MQIGSVEGEVLRRLPIEDTFCTCKHSLVMDGKVSYWRLFLNRGRHRHSSDVEIATAGDDDGSGRGFVGDPMAVANMQSNNS
jgi:hypothetical protein